MNFYDALNLAKSGESDAATLLMMEEFVKLQSPGQRVSLCKWIASCFEGLGEYGSAAEWYEMTGILSLAETSSDAANAIRALPEYERARAYYSICDDEEKVELCSSVITELNKCFVAS